MFVCVCARLRATYAASSVRPMTPPHSFILSHLCTLPDEEDPRLPCPRREQGEGGAKPTFTHTHTHTHTCVLHQSGIQAHFCTRSPAALEQLLPANKQTALRLRMAVCRSLSLLWSFPCTFACFTVHARVSRFGLLLLLLCCRQRSFCVGERASFGDCLLPSVFASLGVFAISPTVD